MPDRPYSRMGLLLGSARHDSPRKNWMGKVGGESVPCSSSCWPIAVEVRRKRLTGINREKLGIPIQPINRSTDQPISRDDYDYRVTTAFRKRYPFPLGEMGAFPRAEGVSRVDQFKNQATAN